MDYAIALAAGLLSFLSPCILPLIPAYFSYMIGSSAADARAESKRSDALAKASFFVLGFSVVFVLLGISVSSISRLFSDHLDLIQRIGGVLIVAFGIHMTGLIRLRWLYKEKRLQMPAKFAGNGFAPLLMGMAFAIGWTPCIGPVLSSILIYAGSLGTLDKGVLLLALYALGMGMPFLLSALLVDRLSRLLKRVNKYLPAIAVASGAIVILMGVLVYTNRLEALGQYDGIFNL
ncbi:cytochrome c biogenesis CcdA family protein [Cohnella sp. GCM10027633]|uniref:cytochrome c biogenesis CcdA family protein n=1 Tax=unclassified Cohnella TaxID=2636738 RepID=UPI003631986F